MADLDSLNDLLPSLKNMVATPGTFATFFPNSTDDDVVLLLADGLAECQLYGMLKDLATDSASDMDTTRTFTNAEGALIVLFAAIRLIRAELFNRITSVHYEASGAIYETTQATNILRDIMAALTTQKDNVLALFSEAGGASAAFYMADSYTRNVAHDWWAGYYGTGAWGYDD
jgi:hypothetical protein